MAKTSPNSTSKMEALSSAKKAVARAKKDLGNVEAALVALVGLDESSWLGGTPPSTKKRPTWSPDAGDKENSSSICKQLNPRVAKKGGLVFDLDKIKAAGTPKKSTPTYSMDRVSKSSGFARAIKEMNANKTTPNKKVRKCDGKGRGVKSSAAGLFEKVKVGKEVNDEEEVVYEVKARPYCLCPGDTVHETYESSAYAWARSDAGTLRIYRHKLTGKARLVQRNRLGTVKLNVMISDGMYCLEKVRVAVQRRVRQPKEATVIHFVAVADEKRGVEYFRIKVNPEKVDPLFDKLKEMGASLKGSELQVD